MAKQKNSSKCSTEKEFMNNFYQLQSRAKKLEDELKNNMIRVNSFFSRDDFNFEKEFEQQSEERSTNRNSLQIKLSSVKKDTINALENVSDPDEKQRIIQETIDSVTLCKEELNSIFIELSKTEKRANDELFAFDKRLEHWDAPRIPQHLAIQASTKPQEVNVDMSCKLPIEVTEFQRFLQLTGGHQGGWDCYHHQLFLQLQKKYTTFESFMEKAKGWLWRKTDEEIESHMFWYQEYSTRKANQKLALENWKKNKALQKERKNGKESDCNQKQKDALAQENAELQEILKQWKEKKIFEREEQEKLKKEKAQKDMEKSKQKKNKQAKVSEKVKEYQKSKEEEKDLLEMEEKAKSAIEKKKKGEIAASLISQFQERDGLKLKIKQEKIKEKEMAMQLKKEALDQLCLKAAVTVLRDPARLHQLTESWKERSKKAENLKLEQPAKIPQRAVPEWRKCLSTT